MAAVATANVNGTRSTPDFSNVGSRLRKPEFGRFGAGRASAPSLAAVVQEATSNSSPPPAHSIPTNQAEINDCVAVESNNGHIRVAVRVRPLPHGESGIIEVAGEGVIAIRKEAATGGNQFLATQQGRIEERQFDRVFGPDASQEEVYAWTCEPLIQKAMTDGRNATVFVYGATGAGKTHTMFGVEEGGQQGIIFRTVNEVFDRVEKSRSHAGSEESRDAEEEPTSWLEVRVSFLELYNEAVRDLLQDGAAPGSCKVLEDERRGMVHVSNLVEVPVRNADEALELLRAGMEGRTVEATAANSLSSRAHAVFSLSVERVGRRPMRRNGVFQSQGSEVRAFHSKISLIDLAGSERAKDPHNSGSALKDGARINQSLLALANCIDALTAKGGSKENRVTAASLRKKPPYRDSKLTLMLKGSLTGDGLVAMVGNVHPGRSHFEDSNNTLEYALRASALKPREQRRCRASTAGQMQIMHPTGIPQLSAGNRSRRRLSEPTPASARRPRQSLAADEDEAVCIPSSSTLTAPSNRMRFQGKNIYGADGGRAPARTKLDLKRTAFTWTTEACADVGLLVGGDSAESTASSPGLTSPRNDQCDDPIPVNTSTPEECLSELSLEEEEEDEFEALCESSGEETEQANNRPEVLVDCEVSCNTEWVTMHTPLGKENMAIPGFAVRIIENLQAEKVEMDFRLSAIASERDALLQDRAQLESANMKLWKANLEKDKQLAALLARTAATPCRSPCASPSPLQAAAGPTSPSKRNAEAECGGCCRMLQLGRGTHDCPICQGSRTSSKPDEFY